MLPHLAEILQDTLNLTRYASSPFVLNGRPDSIRQWLETLRERLTTLVDKTDGALSSLDRTASGAFTDWTDEERVLSLEWIARNYPNESVPVQEALRKAWRDGQRQSASRPGSIANDATS